MEHQNWNYTVLSKNKKISSKKLSKNPSSQGNVEIIRKTSGHGSKMHKILEKDEIGVPKLGLDFKIAMLKARNAKGLTQKQLAHRIAVKETIVKSYESGKAVPQNHIIQKIEKVLGVKLPRPPKKKKAKKK